MNKEIEDFLSKQRYLTEEESEAYQKCLDKIYTPTGLNFFDLLDDNYSTTPKLMQYAEPEYMCECGYKFYVYDWKPNYCSDCGKKFNWEQELIR